MGAPFYKADQVLFRVFNQLDELIRVNGSSSSSNTQSEIISSDHTVNHVLTSGYTEIAASTSFNAKEIEIFDDSGLPCYVAFGAASFEIDTFVMFPGGNGRIQRSVPAGTRLSLKAFDTDIILGKILINLYG